MAINISDYFSQQKISDLTKEANRSVDRVKLTSPALDILEQKKLPNLFVPRQYGGLQRNLPEALPWLEAVSWIDGSLGWTLTLASGAGLLGAFMTPAFARSVFSQKDTLIAVSGFPAGKAEKIDGGYHINGSWKYASGIEHATLITASCYVTVDGKIQHKEGAPVTRAIACYQDEIEIRKTWNSHRLKATGSHDFEIRDVQTPKKRTFTISPDSAHVDGLLYRYPFEAFAHCTLAISMLGIARRFLDEAKQILLSKNDVSELNGLPKALQITFKDTKLEFDKAKEALYKTVEHSWRKLQKYGALDEEWANEVSAQSRQSCKTALRCVQDLYPHLGMSDINPDSIIY
jgi:alkylation response protein AidB-like acyl-CoA dehydrogenase